MNDDPRKKLRNITKLQESVKVKSQQDVNGDIIFQKRQRKLHAKQIKANPLLNKTNKAQTNSLQRRLASAPINPIKQKIKQNNNISIFDILVALGVVSIGTLSIFRQFSSYGNLDQFGKPVSFSMGPGHSNSEYFFQVTLWNLWLAVAAYIVIYDIIINRWMRRKQKITPTQGVMNRMFATLAVGVSFVYWSGMGVQRALSGNSNAFYLLNTFCLHFLIPMIALLYYYVRHKNAPFNENPEAADKNNLIAKLRKGNLYYWFGCFSICSILFTSLSFVLQYVITTNYTPVYDIINWHGGFMSIGMAAATCIAMPFIFTAILYIMHVDNRFTKNFGKPFIFGTIMSAMSFTLTYGALHNCVGLNSELSFGISVGVVLFSLLLTVLAYKKLSNTNAFECTFPRFFAKNNPNHQDDELGNDLKNSDLLARSQ